MGQASSPLSDRSPWALRCLWRLLSLVQNQAVSDKDSEAPHPGHAWAPRAAVGPGKACWSLMGLSDGAQKAGNPRLMFIGEWGVWKGPGAGAPRVSGGLGRLTIEPQLLPGGCSATHRMEEPGWQPPSLPRPDWEQRLGCGRSLLAPWGPGSLPTPEAAVAACAQALGGSLGSKVYSPTFTSPCCPPVLG